MSFRQDPSFIALRACTCGTVEATTSRLNRTKLVPPCAPQHAALLPRFFVLLALRCRRDALSSKTANINTIFLRHCLTTGCDRRRQDYIQRTRTMRLVNACQHLDKQRDCRLGGLIAASEPPDANPPAESSSRFRLLIVENLSSTPAFLGYAFTSPKGNCVLRRAVESPHLQCPYDADRDRGLWSVPRGSGGSSG